MHWFPRRGGEKFLIIDALPDRIGGALLLVDEDRHIAPLDIWEDFPVKKIPRLLPPRVALAIHHSLLFAKEIPIELVREKESWNTPFDSIELENAAAQAIGKSFQEYRRDAAKFLNVNEFDAVLINNTMNDFVVDGRPVESLGAPRAKKITAALRLQFAPRELFEKLKSAWNAPGGFSLIAREEGKFRALRKHDSRADGLLVFERNGTSGGAAILFSKNGQASGVERKPLSWSPGSIDTEIARATGTEPITAQAIYRAYLSGEMSPAALRTVKSVISPTISALKDEISSAARIRAITVEPQGILPPDFRVHVADFDDASRKLAAEFGFSIETAEWNVPPHEIFGYLAAFLEHYYDKSDHALNQRLQRRIHWLAPLA